MLQPKKQKFRKQFRGSWRNIAIKGDKINFGTHGIKCLSSGWITDRQIEACRVVLARATRKVGRFWIRIFPHQAYSKKPPEVTMGAGKGDVSHFVAAVAPGTVLFEFEGLDEETAKHVHGNLSAKLGVKTKLVQKNI
ncbi:50S ribosomal protein L16 [Candidatus Roizmanbacteria bacterium RIFCSPLOWO2_02_FULL_37_19]|uniref:50S ribosomal protein L16 n=1 Tax=Candidatus Roizmanbacteria bacterium RIFCSPHIGHO2_02_FULL_37_24 TaxID=1802037 RepID=A0A1F7GVJ3_9BACT|nr:MAG: 50S ribosomal protein L16 [Candidatus Roizmanbacteria bacterium RIFCSPHIGHO2_01_FULL_38_41]OGK23060.1 MAG: 50S ribosomal protein L16 [Candidatus Roizmanbacteria bacterium RIFCSPHIGHO2_02_FULL_37_24]OGK33413.1 MAG: 50S ribosomal protein L16 [Candidatus Roizmanbacteria bacterium RIFCSPHIGHO2_12_FULL_37_23]OGK43477.1 MAG: 50S ribosomal protein L16 [Candidatus Roizmanbacteria bacterium RIFCSPLOWO2_01_FULL_37_57]OGK54422.1 MAG: 50S ribosomal protein L16 [Candidatus Roizmanbacteria bacterium 